jgi:hypothetical protein
VPFYLSLLDAMAAKLIPQGSDHFGGKRIFLARTKAFQQ